MRVPPSGPVVLMLFAAFSLLLCVFRAGYLLSVMACKPAPKVLSPFFEAPFLALQVTRPTCTSGSTRGRRNITWIVVLLLWKEGIVSFSQ